ncbi:MAG TPA: hypothetical protein VD771_07735 [Gemmatimonadaceae bacterium]|nr:hypothetical protein [Gemmatimonadaceae bacterium]
MAFYRRATGVIPEVETSLRRMPPRRHFILRMVRSTAIATGAIGVGLLIGMLGYHWFGRLNWEESFYYASMILSGEGPPPDPAITGPALANLHIFAGFYALFSGVTFITMVGILLGPALHRFLHRFHLEISTPDEPTNQSS